MSTDVTKTLQLKKICALESVAESHFFNSASFFKTKPFEVEGWQLIKDKPVVQVFFSIINRKAISGHQATFGSFDVVEAISQEELNWFVKGFLKELELMGVQEIELRHYPDYFKNSSALQAALQTSGFEIETKEVNQHIEITSAPFEKLAKRNEVKKIRQSEEAGFVFKVVDASFVKLIYELIVEARERRGYPVSMTFDALHQAIQTTPDNYVLFTLWNKEELIAASVSVVLTKEALYNFYHADAFAYRQKSPLAYLVKCIYEYCQQFRFKILDLGISSEHGNLNEGLFTFKQNLGAIVSDKITYQLTL